MNNETLIFFESIVILSLLIASAVAVVAHRLRIPYTVGLVLIGLLMTVLLPPEWHVEIPPQVILALLVPPLVFEAAFHIRFEQLNRDLLLILLLAVPGVILTTLLVGVTILSGTSVRLEGKNPFAWPITLRYRGMTIKRGLESTEVSFLNGKSVTVTDNAACVVSA